MKILPNTIIYFHEIHDKQWFTTIIESLLKNYNIIDLQELENYYYNNKKLKNSCHITFDDGDISFYKNAFPIIKKYNIPVSVYVSPLVALGGQNFWFQEIRGYDPYKLSETIRKITGYKFEFCAMGEIKNYLKSLRIDVILEIIKSYQKETNTSPKLTMNMNENQLIEINTTGLVDIGAHTLNHPQLINETVQTATYEIEESIDQLSNILKKQVKFFVYPNGNYSDREISILKNKGIKLAFTTERGKLSGLNNPLSIPRNGSPLISELNNSKAYTYSKCLLQLMAGEKLYYKYAESWNTYIYKRS